MVPWPMDICRAKASPLFPPNYQAPQPQRPRLQSANQRSPIRKIPVTVPSDAAQSKSPRSLMEIQVTKHLSFTASGHRTPQVLAVLRRTGRRTPQREFPRRLRACISSRIRPDSPPPSVLSRTAARSFCQAANHENRTFSASSTCSAVLFACHHRLTSNSTPQVLAARFSLVFALLHRDFFLSMMSLSCSIMPKWPCKYLQGH